MEVDVHPCALPGLCYPEAFPELSSPLGSIPLRVFTTDSLYPLGVFLNFFLLLRVYFILFYAYAWNLSSWRSTVPRGKQGHWARECRQPGGGGHAAANANAKGGKGGGKGGNGGRDGGKRVSESASQPRDKGGAKRTAEVGPGLPPA